MAILDLPNRKKPYVMAHRGNRVRYPENTLSAFKQAIEDGADILETDLHLTADGEIICIHDSTVDRTTDGSGRVDSMTLRQIRQLNAAARDPSLPAEPVPTLTELANLIPSDMGLAVELKDKAFFQPSKAKQIIGVLKETDIYSRSVALSFHREHLDAVHKANSTFPLGLITISTPYPVSGFQMIGPFWPLLILNPSYVWWAHLQGQVICPLDPAPEARLWYYRFLGCDAVLSDDPGKTCRALNRGL
ncbi:MAG: glycerophosphodiester phosphodiesterase family protein [Anaerolineales bacterium]|jgi:glycerophosphoryl diester phosphodiesterase